MLRWLTSECKKRRLRQEELGLAEEDIMLVGAEEIRREALAQRLDANGTHALLESLSKAGWLRRKDGQKTGKRGPIKRRWQINPILLVDREA